MDRFTKGLIAGIAGSIVMDTWGFISFYLLEFTNLLYTDWASVLVFGDRPGNWAEFLFSLLTQIVWTTLLAIIVAFLFPFISSHIYLLKGAFIGFVLSFIFNAIPILYKAPHLYQISTNTAISTSIGAVLWGLTVSKILHRLEFNVR